MGKGASQIWIVPRQRPTRSFVNFSTTKRNATRIPMQFENGVCQPQHGKCDLTGNTAVLVGAWQTGRIRTSPAVKIARSTTRSTRKLRTHAGARQTLYGRRERRADTSVQAHAPQEKGGRDVLLSECRLCEWCVQQRVLWTKTGKTTRGSVHGTV